MGFTKRTDALAEHAATLLQRIDALAEHTAALLQQKG